MILYWVLAAAVVGAAILLHVAGLVEFDTGLPWNAWIVAPLVLLSGGWMAFDGGRSLITGTYVTPGGTGALGPWANVVRAAGLDPHSIFMRTVFLTYGTAYLGATAAFLLGASGARWAVIVVAALGLWYIPFGTLINLTVILLLTLPILNAANVG